jgi:hypothetical protein
VAEGDGERVLLLDREALAACGKDPSALIEAIRAAAAARNLAIVA